MMNSLPAPNARSESRTRPADPASGRNSLKTASPPAVDRALAILEELAASNRGLRLPDIAQRLKLPKSSAHSLLVGLERRGYLQRNESNGRYLFGPKIFTLANLALSGMTLRDVAYPILANLMRRTGLVVNMSVMDRDQAVLIEQISPLQTRSNASWLGMRLDLHCTALGKALAAFQPPEQWTRLIKERALPRHNDNTIATGKGFLREMELTRERGYAVDNEELDLGVHCLAVPVFGARNEIVAAISLAGSTEEINDSNTASLVALLRAAASAIEQALGTRPEVNIQAAGQTAGA
jgi:DNA-binding IclR family transcriptional regulator